MQTIKQELSKEDYNKLKQMTYMQQHDFLFPDGVPVVWECGYGYYGHSIWTDGKECWAEFKIGKSCD